MAAPGSRLPDSSMQAMVSGQSIYFPRWPAAWRLNLARLGSV
jgi:hypothetical protein